MMSLAVEASFILNVTLLLMLVVVGVSIARTRSLLVAIDPQANTQPPPGLEGGPAGRHDPSTAALIATRDRELIDFV